MSRVHHTSLRRWKTRSLGHAAFAVLANSIIVLQALAQKRMIWFVCFQLFSAHYCRVQSNCQITVWTSQNVRNTRRFRLSYIISSVICNTATTNSLICGPLIALGPTVYTGATAKYCGTVWLLFMGCFKYFSQPLFVTMATCASTSRF